ncbi:hypothetical protein [Bradyrhizobium sp. ORS 285]|uniref:hypothetical protein n=2 Tax=Bradyrhizobium sp. ORS 285 TaxID=115808 RepID=UPI001FCA7105|nr:hypothetical protein [Bradyrhizobium sp. ORS 285]
MRFNGTHGSLCPKSWQAEFFLGGGADRRATAMHRWHEPVDARGRPHHAGTTVAVVWSLYVMIKLSGIAVASLLAAGLMSATALAQSAPAADTPAQPAPAATPSPTPNASPAAAPTATSDKPAETKPAADAAAPKKKKRTKTTRQEVEDSLRSGKVPSRYRSRVPKEYQKYIPFDR